jgi:integrase
MMSALQQVFRPGHSRFEDKRYGRKDRIRGIRTMRCMIEDAFQFSRYVRAHHPTVHALAEVTPPMAQGFIQDLADADRSSGYLTRKRASLRKLDRACRLVGIFPPGQAELLPLEDRCAPGEPKPRHTPQAYTPDQIQRLIAAIAERDATIADVLLLMAISGLRVSEAVYLRAQDILLDQGCIVLESNANHTKGGRPRRVVIPAQDLPLLARLQARGKNDPEGHLFNNRRNLRMRAKDLVRHTCPKLEIPNLGTHGFRRAFAAAEYLRAVRAGATDRQALLTVSHQLGHNRIQVAAYSYVPAEIRIDKLRRGRPRKTTSPESPAVRNHNPHASPAHPRRGRGARSHSTRDRLKAGQKET